MLDDGLGVDLVVGGDHLDAGGAVAEVRRRAVGEGRRGWRRGDSDAPVTTIREGGRGRRAEVEGGGARGRLPALPVEPEVALEVEVRRGGVHHDGDVAPHRAPQREREIVEAVALREERGGGRGPDAIDDVTDASLARPRPARHLLLDEDLVVDVLVVEVLVGRLLVDVLLEFEDLHRFVVGVARRHLSLHHHLATVGPVDRDGRRFLSQSFN